MSNATTMDVREGAVLAVVDGVTVLVAPSKVEVNQSDAIDLVKLIERAVLGQNPTPSNREMAALARVRKVALEL